MFGNKDPDFIEGRKQGLQRCLNIIFDTPGILEVKCVFKYLRRRCVDKDFAILEDVMADYQSGGKQEERKEEARSTKKREENKEPDTASVFEAKQKEQMTKNEVNEKCARMVNGVADQLIDLGFKDIDSIQDIIIKSEQFKKALLENNVDKKFETDLLGLPETAPKAEEEADSVSAETEADSLLTKMIETMDELEKDLYERQEAEFMHENCVAKY